VNGCFDNSPEDRARSRELDRYLASQEPDEDDEIEDEDEEEFEDE